MLPAQLCRCVVVSFPTGGHQLHNVTTSSAFVCVCVGTSDRSDTHEHNVVLWRSILSFTLGRPTRDVRNKAVTQLSFRVRATFDRVRYLFRTTQTLWRYLRVVEFIAAIAMCKIMSFDADLRANGSCGLDHRRGARTLVAAYSLGHKIRTLFMPAADMRPDYIIFINQTTNAIQ